MGSLKEHTQKFWGEREGAFFKMPPHKFFKIPTAGPGVFASHGAWVILIPPTIGRVSSYCFYEDHRP